MNLHDWEAHQSHVMMNLDGISANTQLDMVGTVKATERTHVPSKVMDVWS